MCSNLCHGLHSLYRIFPVSRLTTEHQSICTIIDGIGNIGHLGTGRTRIIDHGVQHLRSHNHRFLGQDTFADEQTLDARNTLLRHFNAQVTTSHHHTVGHFQNLVDIVHTLLIFNLGNDTDVAVMLVQYGFDIENILPVAHKRMGNKIDVLLNGIQNIILVLFGQRRQIDAYTWHVHTLTVAQRSLVLHLTEKMFIILVYNNHFQVAVVYQDMPADVYILHKMRIGYGDTFVCRRLVGTAHYLNLVTHLERDGTVGQRSCPYFRPFGIHQYGNPIGNCTDIGYQFLKTFTTGMSRIHTNHVHTRLKQLSDKVNLTTLVGNSCNNLRLFQ